MEIHVSVKPETLWEIGLGPLGTLNITNSFFTMILVMAAIIIAGGLIARKVSVDKPNRKQSAFEVVVEFLLNLVEGTAGKRVGRRIFPLVGALFFFIIIANYSGLLPGVGTIGLEEEEPVEEEEAALVASVEQRSSDLPIAFQEEEEHEEEHTVLEPFLRSPSADLNMTLAMSLLTFTIVQIAGISAHGIGGRLKHMADPWFIFPIEVVSELSRIISLSFRLFGNIFAGEVLVTVMVTMSRTVLEKFYVLPLVALPTIFLFLEVLFGFIQALVFALLTLIYITLAAAGGHDDHEEHDEAHAHGTAQQHQPVPAAAGSGGD